MKRETYIDLYRGLAALSIVIIHTVFHSGSSYVPYWFANLSLLLDVPFFFFLSGWGASYTSGIGKTIKSIWFLWCKWLYFVLIVLILIKFMGRSGFLTGTDFFKALFFMDFPVESFPSVQASLWYMPVYIAIAVCGRLFLDWYNKLAPIQDGEKPKIMVLYAVSGFCLAGIIYTSLGGYSFSISSYFWFYGLFFIAGFGSAGYRIKNFKSVLSIVCFLCASWFLSSKILKVPMLDLQSTKFPPKFMYLFASLISVSTALYYKWRLPDRVVNSFLSHIGKNAVFYYYAQGAGASLLYVINNSMPELNWAVRLCAMIFINLCITALLAEFLILSYSYIDRVIKKWFSNIVNNNKFLKQK